MLIHKMGFDLLGGIKTVAGSTQSWASQEWHKRIIQICAFGAILFFALSSYDLIGMVDKQLTSILGVKVGKEGTRVLHALTFGILLYFSIIWFLDPLFKRLLNGKLVEGQSNGTCSISQYTKKADCLGATPTAGVWTTTATAPVTGATYAKANTGAAVYSINLVGKKTPTTAQIELNKKLHISCADPASGTATDNAAHAKACTTATLRGTKNADQLLDRNFVFDHTHKSDGTVNWTNPAAAHPELDDLLDHAGGHHKRDLVLEHIHKPDGTIVWTNTFTMTHWSGKNKPGKVKTNGGGVLRDSPIAGTEIFKHTHKK